MSPREVIQETEADKDFLSSEHYFISVRAFAAAS
jgi:hypothetical protein